MKRAYDIPSSELLKVSTEMIAVSPLKINPDEYADKDGEVLVKDGNNSESLWDENW